MKKKLISVPVESNVFSDHLFTLYNSHKKSTAVVMNKQKESKNHQMLKIFSNLLAEVCILLVTSLSIFYHLNAPFVALL